MVQLFAFLLTLWAGIGIGVSFIATPSKFLAPSLKTPIAVDIVKATFHVFRYIEWSFYGVVLVIGLFFHGCPDSYQVTLSILGVMLFLQSFWLLPILDKNIIIIIKGGTPEPSLHHLYYVTLEVLKILIAGYTAWAMIRV
jgi:hypothetical protein